MKRLAAILLVGALAMTACANDSEPEGTPRATQSESESPTASDSPRHAESDACRQQAGEVIDILALVPKDTDIRDAAGRLDTADKMLPGAVAQCSSAVAVPVRQARDVFSKALDVAMSGKSPGKQLARGEQLIDEAKAALAAQ